MKKYLIVLALISTALAGCTRTEKHIATGAVVGAVAGHAIAGDRGALIGAGVGAGTGALIADEKYNRDYDYDDNDDDDEREHRYYKYNNGRRNHKKYR